MPARLKPAQTQTIFQPETLNDRRIDVLIDREPDIAIALENCDPNSPCGSLVCASCSEQLRQPFIAELLRIADLYEGPHEFATIHLASYPAGSLGTANIGQGHDRLRKQLQRNGFAGSILIGGTEAGWSHDNAVWILHVHLVAIGVPREAWTRLRATLKNSRAPTIPLKRQPLNNVEYQISYALKFLTCHWPGARGGLGRGMAYPLPPDRIAELVAWWSRHTIADFKILFGARTRGGKIIPDA
jgi:hypothetical protein